jgi:hypothetical protein
MLRDLKAIVRFAYAIWPNVQAMHGALKSFMPSPLLYA